MINLNGDEFKSQIVAIFNNGIAGKVENVSVSVEKKSSADTGNTPDYKVIFTDSVGSINMGIYYPSDQSTDGQNRILAGKCADLVKAVTSEDYVFPDYNSYKELVDGCMTILAQNCNGKLVSLIATYGTVGAPKKYLGVYKNFNFVEKAGSAPTKLRITSNPNKPEYNDLLERIVEDAPREFSDSAEVKIKNVDWL